MLNKNLLTFFSKGKEFVKIAKNASKHDYKINLQQQFVLFPLYLFLCVLLDSSKLSAMHK